MPGLNAALAVADAFAGMIRRTVTTGGGGPAWARFAAGLRADEAAVVAALTTPWSNGPVEGQVSRLKAIKRQTYGRANRDLLAARVL